VKERKILHFSLMQNLEIIIRHNCKREFVGGTSERKMGREGNEG
jgi:hypothetical protein